METIQALVLIFAGIICVGFMLIIGGVLEKEYRGNTSKADRLQCVGIIISLIGAVAVFLLVMASGIVVVAQ